MALSVRFANPQFASWCPNTVSRCPCEFTSGRRIGISRPGGIRPSRPGRATRPSWVSSEGGPKQTAEIITQYANIHGRNWVSLSIYAILHAVALACCLCDLIWPSYSFRLCRNSYFRPQRTPYLRAPKTRRLRLILWCPTSLAKKHVSRRRIFNDSISFVSNSIARGPISTLTPQKEHEKKKTHSETL